MLSDLKSKKWKWILVITFIFSAVIRAFLEWMLFDFVSDKKVQIATALNFLEGNGISLAYVEASDLSKVFYERVGLWPPGFALSIAPFIKLGFSPIRASIIVDVVSIFILFYSFYLIFKLLKNRIHFSIPIIFFVFYGFSLQPFNFLFTSGLAALSFCVFSLYFLVRTLNGKPDYFSWIGLGLASFLPSFFHFSYYPISFILPLLLLLYAFFVEGSKKRCAISNFLICMLLLAGQMYYQASLQTGVNYLSSYHPDTAGAPYWENLKMFMNLPVYLLTDNFTLKRAIEGVNSSLFHLLSIIVGIFFIFSLFQIKKDLYKSFKREGLDFLKKLEAQFVVISLILSWLTIVFLVFLSLKYPPENARWMPDHLWTYVAEARYFAPVIILLPVALIVGLWKYLQKPLVRVSFMILFLSGLLFSTSVNLYYIFKYGSGTPEENFVQYYHHSYEFENYLKEELLKSEEHLLVYAKISDFDEYIYYPMMHTIPLVKPEVFQKELKASSPVKILLNSHDKLEPEAKETIQRLVDEYNLSPVQEFPDLGMVIYELNLP